MYEVYECGSFGRCPVRYEERPTAEEAWASLSGLYVFGLEGYVVAPDGRRMGISDCPDEVYSRFADYID